MYGGRRGTEHYEYLNLLKMLDYEPPSTLIFTDH